jgi:hypothetical protein
MYASRLTPEGPHVLDHGRDVIDGATAGSLHVVHAGTLTDLNRCGSRHQIARQWALRSPPGLKTCQNI